MIRSLCQVALILWSSSAFGDELLRISPRPKSEAAGLNVSHPDLPENSFDFRTCEAVLDGNRDFGLFRVKLAPPGTQGAAAWSTNHGSFGYEWCYPEGIIVQFRATAETGRLALA